MLEQSKALKNLSVTVVLIGRDDSTGGIELSHEEVEVNVGNAWTNHLKVQTRTINQNHRFPIQSTLVVDINGDNPCVRFVSQWSKAQNIPHAGQLRKPKQRSPLGLTVRMT